MSLTTRQTKLDAEWDRVERLAGRLVTAFAMGWCDIVFKRSDTRKEGDERTAAETLAEWQYRHAAIVVYTPVTLAMDDEDLEDVLAHELVHVLNNSMEFLCKDDEKSTAMRELATENVTRALMAALRASRELPA